MLAILTKIKSNEIAIFQDALKYYASFLKTSIENQQQFNNSVVANFIVTHSKYEFHIANDLWREFNKKLDRIPQPLNSTLKLSYYKADTLKNALLNYQVELPTTNLDRAIIERLKQPLIQQT